MGSYAVIFRNGTIVEDVRIERSAFEAGVAAARMIRAHPVAWRAHRMEITSDSLEVMDGEYRVDAWPVEADADADEVWVGVYIAPEGYLDTVVVLEDERNAHRFVLAEPSDPRTFTVLDRNHLVASDDPDEEGGYTHAFRISAQREAPETS